MKNRKKILIVGGGIAGLSLLQFLKHTPYGVTLVEKADRLRAEGAGIMLGINATKLLTKLGLTEQLLAHGESLDAFCLVDSSGYSIAKSDSQQMRQQTGLPTVGIHRADLQRILANGIDESQIRFGTYVKAIINSGNKKEICFSDNSTESFDLVIVADGLHASSRQLCNVRSELRYSGYTCWRFIIKLPNKVNPTGYEMWGKGKRFGIVPIGQNTVYCFATCNATENDNTFKNISIDAFKQLFCEFGGIAEQILSELSAQHYLIHNDLYDQQNICMVDNGVAFMGDAAHAATPNMGQGAGMAIEDAFVLSDSLVNTPSITEALTIYQQKRTKRVTTIRDKSYTIGKIAQWESKLASTIRNRLFKLLPADGLTKNQLKLLLDF